MSKIKNINISFIVILFISVFGFVSCTEKGTSAFVSTDGENNEPTDENTTTETPEDTTDENTTTETPEDTTDENTTTETPEDTTDEYTQVVEDGEIALVLDDSSNVRLTLKQNEEEVIYLSVQNSDLLDLETSLQIEVTESDTNILGTILTEKVSTARFKVTLEGINLGQTVLTFTINGNSSLTRQMLVTVVNPASTTYIASVCENLDLNGKTLITDVNNDDGASAEDEAIVLTSRVSTVTDYEKTRVSIFYETENNYLDLVNQTIFLKNSDNDLVATMNYSSTLLGTNFHIVYTDFTTDTEVCISDESFPESIEESEELVIELSDEVSNPF